MNDEWLFMSDYKRSVIASATKCVIANEVKQSQIISLHYAPLVMTTTHQRNYRN